MSSNYIYVDVEGMESLLRKVQRLEESMGGLSPRITALGRSGVQLGGFRLHSAAPNCQCVRVSAHGSFHDAMADYARAIHQLSTQLCGLKDATAEALRGYEQAEADIEQMMRSIENEERTTMNALSADEARAQQAKEAEMAEEMRRRREAINDIMSPEGMTALYYAEQQARILNIITRWLWGLAFGDFSDLTADFQLHISGALIRDIVLDGLMDKVEYQKLEDTAGIDSAQDLIKLLGLDGVKDIVGDGGMLKEVSDVFKYTDKVTDMINRYLQIMSIDNDKLRSAADALPADEKSSMAKSMLYDLAGENKQSIALSMVLSEFGYQEAVNKLGDAAQDAVAESINLAVKPTATGIDVLTNINDLPGMVEISKVLTQNAQNAYDNYKTALSEYDANPSAAALERAENAYAFYAKSAAAAEKQVADIHKKILDSPLFGAVENMGGMKNTREIADYASHSADTFSKYADAVWQPDKPSPSKPAGGGGR